MYAWFSPVRSSTTASGARSGGTLTSDDGPRSPPQPPAPRTKVVTSFLKRSRPFSSKLWVSVMTSAFFPLSKMSFTRDLCVSFAAGGRGAYTSVNCSPCSTRSSP